jgi:hypothetical protein
MRKSRATPKQRGDKTDDDSMPKELDNRIFGLPKFKTVAPSKSCPFDGNCQWQADGTVCPCFERRLVLDHGGQLR